jgi:hypothetical protein
MMASGGAGNSTALTAQIGPGQLDINGVPDNVAIYARCMIDASSRAVVAETASGRGVVGIAPDGTAVYGVALTGANARGVIGETSSGRGVNGIAQSGRGVQGQATSGRGVYGYATSGYGGYFERQAGKTGTALRAVGPVKFDNCSGIATINSGSSSVLVTPGIDLTAASAVVATLQGSAGGTTTVHRCTVNATNNTFTIYLTGNSTASVKVAWHVFG